VRQVRARGEAATVGAPFLVFLTRRVLWALFLVLAATMLTYLLFWVLPADPTTLGSADSGRVAQYGPAVAAELRRYWHLDEPVWKQYWFFLQRLVEHGSLGYSFADREPVDSIVARAAPVTASLVFGGAVLWLTMALPLGVLAALRPRTLLDRSAMSFALVGISAHPIWIGLVLSYVFGYRLGLTPIEGYCNMFRAPPGECSGVIPWAEHMILPWITFMLLFAALYVRLIRGAMMETLTEDYVRTARAKGVGPRRLLFHHVLRNSLLPVVTIFGMDLGLAIGAALFTENVFGLPGLGNQMLQAYTYADLPSITGITLFAAICVVVLNLVVDVLYSVLDPRIVLTS
jgi:peptide/nickel transport system permease protein